MKKKAWRLDKQGEKMILAHISPGVCMFCLKNLYKHVILRRKSLVFLCVGCYDLYSSYDEFLYTLFDMDDL